MRLLLDTHTLLWLVDGHPNLSGSARSALMDPENDFIQWICKSFDTTTLTGRAIW